MQQGKTLLENAVRDLEASRTTSATAAGQAEASAAAAQREARIDAINQIFALFRLNYHNQYYSAFPDSSQLNQIKKLWLEALAQQAPDTLLRAARRCIEESEYLPTLKRFLEFCREECPLSAGLPDSRSAYREACLAAEPKAAQDWSHPAVYHAGREVGWFFLATTPEAAALPVFSREYDRQCRRVLAGDKLALPTAATDSPPARSQESKEQRRERLQALRRKTGL